MKQVEKRDAALTKEQQIERLTKPGSKYGNLNPFAVLMVGYDADETTTRKQFRKLSILTHPDKNPDQKVSFACKTKPHGLSVPECTQLTLSVPNFL